MSAFIVSENTMARCVDAITHPIGSYRLRLDVGTAFQGKDGQTVGQMLYGLNTRAVNGRYGEANEPPKYDHPTTTYLSLPIIAYYKALGCLVYQCSEAPADSEPLYDDLRHCHAMLAHEIAQRTPAYADAQWEAR